MIPIVVKTSELKLADVIRLNPDSELMLAFMTATVEQITVDCVICIRPYIHTADFSSTSGVITYIGFEKISLVISESREVILLERKELK